MNLVSLLLIYDELDILIEIFKTLFDFFLVEIVMVDLVLALVVYVAVLECLLAVLVARKHHYLFGEFIDSLLLLLYFGEQLQVVVALGRLQGVVDGYQRNRGQLVGAFEVLGIGGAH